MEAAKWNIRECSVRLRRCDVEDPRSTARAYRGVSAAPHEPVAPGAPYSIDRVQRNYTASMLGIKVEPDCEDAVVKQKPDEEHARLWRDSMTEPDLHITEAYSIVLEIKDEIDKSTIKQELEIGPMVLQSRSYPSLDMLNMEACPEEPHPSTSSGSGATQGLLYITHARPPPQTDVEDHHRKEESGVPSDASFVPNLRETDDGHRKLSKQQSDDRCNSEDLSEGTRKFKNKQYECDYSKSGTTRKTILINRIRTYLDVNRYKRERCELSESRVENLKERPTARTGERSYKCEQCEYNTSRLGHFKIHMRTHTGEKPYKCDQCEYSASQLCDLKKHTRIHTGEKPYKCERCEFSASHVSNLKRHMLTHTGEKPYKCDQCEYSAYVQSRLKTHIRAHTGEKPYKCEQCEYSASQLFDLKKHKFAHTGEKPYKCDQCEYSAYVQSRLKTHIRAHTGEKPYKCEQCEYSASQLFDLKKHKFTHTGEKPYKCDQCEYSSYVQSRLKTHIRAHTGEKPYKCEQCSFCASQLGNLKIHMRVHTGERPYKCEQCEYSASQIGHLKRHMWMHTSKKPDKYK